ncbi:exported hypothetical protein [Candidatus Sulfotelmatomonas gaucii]|uniref:Exo-alpha-sialidase n=1 Tax=Candidatus Sulfuritelmatomonas gaucii TaxID=2043161 RepID=A0A2N9L438_9BACT|nr:exported hypothetical protein [Candidatus Sulfotelmatomonas gaucii]
MRRLNLILGMLSIGLSAGVLTAQDLSVKSATGKAVQLEWTGASATAALERSSPQGFAKIAPGDTGHFTDTSIAPFGTYKYRINTGGRFSNEVTVGPPPAGVTNAAPAPAGSEYDKYGPATAVDLDENGDPVIAFEWIDPNGDGDAADTEIRFVRWDRAAYKWVAPVRVITTGSMTDQEVNPIAVSCDRSNGTIAVFTPVGDNLSYEVSTDHGATWKNSSVTNTGGTPHAIAMAIASGQLFAVVNAEQAQTYFTGPAADSSSWKAQSISAGEGWKARNSSNIALAVDSSGNIALGFFEDQEEGDGHRYVLWRPGQKDPVAISTGGTTDTPDIALTYGGNNFGALFAVQLDSNDSDHWVWYSQSSDANSWSKPVKLPIDGPRSTNPPLGLAIDSKGAITAAFGSNSGSDAAVCNSPTVSRSSDGTNWKTCGLGKAAGADFSPQPATLHVIEALNDAAYVVWQEPGETKYKPGVLVWHER